MMVNLSKKRRTRSSRQRVLCGLLINLLLLLFVINVVDVVVDAQQQQGFQHHFDDTSYAGGMAYDASHNVLYVTGQVGEGQCFVGVIKHNNNVDGGGGDSNNQQQFQFLSKHVFEEQAICQSLVVTKRGQGQQINVEEHGGGTALLLSTMEEGGLLTSRRPVGSDHSTLYGGMIEFHVDGIGQNAVYDPNGSVLIHQDLVQIPQSIITGSTATSSQTSNRVFVASLMTENTKPTTEYESWASPAVPPNFTPSGKFHKYGGDRTKYSMSISMIHLKTDFSHAQLGWTKPYGTVPTTATTTTTASGNSTEEEEIPIDSSAYVKQLLLHGKETLFVVGSTRGTGPAFGGKVDTGSTDSDIDSDIGDDSTSTVPEGAMSGFITKLNPETGSLIDTPSLDTVASKRFHLDHASSIDTNNNTTSSSSSSSSSPSGDTYIEAICAAPPDETKDTLGTVEDAVYVVGSYERSSSTVNGDGSVGNNAGMVSVPFVAKLYASSLQTIWRSEFPATTNARALSCGVDDTSGVVYVAGVVDDGGEIMGQTQTKLRDDVFVVQVSKHNGSLAWIRQVGTSGHDHLAHGGSSSMVVLNDGTGVLVFGDTTGNMFSEVSQTHEIFVAHIDANGNTPDTNELSGMQSTGGGDKLPIIHPVQAGNDDTATDSGGPNVDDNNGKPRPPLEAPAPNNNQPQQPSQTQSGVFYKVLAAFTVLGVLALAVIGTRRRREEERSTERALVFSYLQEFDIEDIDVRHSATGGWHGTYVNKLARGVNSRGVEDGTSEVGSDGSGPSSTYSHSSIVRDSLFMDNVDSTSPSYGREEDRENDEVENEQDQSGVPYRDDAGYDDDVEESLARIAEGPLDKEIV
eukprot:CAMPEP_0113493192 /NCGR_PEP_ID=MMETSP0014_2-20120614/28466_1 /TAXON_ID=2857 /ORGANISM="Nitzschia sp." /LENGTH=854 /DNA_ID=CAMNT_0000387049 /DNA_START=543 /DNA_END=3107 /DNA_ORIENTATION=- /assembly_acc=CAM_ASM_000159